MFWLFSPAIHKDFTVFIPLINKVLGPGDNREGDKSKSLLSDILSFFFNEKEINTTVDLTGLL